MERWDIIFLLRSLAVNSGEGVTGGGAATGSAATGGVSTIGSGFLGNLWLIRPANHIFNSLETNLIQHIATECAIAIRQARLYESSQAQVRELEKLERLKSEFLKTLSHELRTPITSIRLAVETLESLLEDQGIEIDPENSIGQLLQILNKKEKKNRIPSCSQQNLLNKLTKSLYIIFSSLNNLQ